MSISTTTVLQTLNTAQKAKAAVANLSVLSGEYEKLKCAHQVLTDHLADVQSVSKIIECLNRVLIDMALFKLTARHLSIEVNQEEQVITQAEKEARHVSTAHRKLMQQLQDVLSMVSVTTAQLEQTNNEKVTYAQEVLNTLKGVTSGLSYKMQEAQAACLIAEDPEDSEELETMSIERMHQDVLDMSWVGVRP